MVDVCETHTVVSSFLLYQGTLIGHVPGNDQCGVRLCGHGKATGFNDGWRPFLLGAGSVRAPAGSLICRSRKLARVIVE